MHAHTQNPRPIHENKDQPSVTDNRWDEKSIDDTSLPLIQLHQTIRFPSLPLDFIHLLHDQYLMDTKVGLARTDRETRMMIMMMALGDCLRAWGPNVTRPHGTTCVTVRLSFMKLAQIMCKLGTVTEPVFGRGSEVFGRRNEPG